MSGATGEIPPPIKGNPNAQIRSESRFIQSRSRIAAKNPGRTGLCAEYGNGARGRGRRSPPCGQSPDGGYRRAAGASVQQGGCRYADMAGPGKGQAARKGAVGPNGRPYFDGRYSPSGAFRKYPSGSGKPHYGIDLPAPVDEPVRAADDGTIFGHGFEKNLGNYVAVRHGDGKVGLYAHLDAYAPLPAGTKVVQGQKIGKVGVSGNAAGQGSHLHFEVREERGKKTLASMSKGAVSVDPTPWIRARTVAR